VCFDGVFHETADFKNRTLDITALDDGSEIWLVDAELERPQLVQLIFGKHPRRHRSTSTPRTSKRVHTVVAVSRKPGADPRISEGRANPFENFPGTT